jgi:hypothetical protein
LSLIDPAGVVSEVRSLRAVHGSAVFGRLRDGTLVLGAFAVMGPDAPSGIRRDSMRVLRLTPEGTRDTLAAFPGFEVVAREFSEGGRRGMGWTMLPFGRNTVVTAGADHVLVGDNAEYRIRVYAAGGRLRRIIELDAGPFPVTDADIEAEKARQARGLPSGELQRRLEELYERNQVLRHRPAFNRILLDELGWLWVRRYVTAADTLATWDVFDDSGRFRCALGLPARYRVDEVGRDYLVGIARDSDDVEQARVYRLRRSP